MFGFVRESTDGLFDIGRGEGFERGFIAAREEFGERGGGCDGSSAPAHLETGLADAAGFDQGGQAQDISANGVRDFDRHGGSGQFADIAGVPEMVE